MPADEELDGLDPVDCMDREAARIEAHLAGLPADGWMHPSRCEGWTIRDVVAHLAASEEYHHACLAGRVSELMQDTVERGATDIASFNSLGIAALADLTQDELVRMWSERNAETRRGFRDRGPGEVDSSIGLYPADWQAFHLAGELATHADDIRVPVPDTDRSSRREWRVRFSRFALTEEKPELIVQRAEGGTRVSGEGIDIVVSDENFIEAVAGRIDLSRLDADARTLLSTMP